MLGERPPHPLEMRKHSIPGSGKSPHTLRRPCDHHPGRALAGSAFRRAWRSARKAVLPPHVYEWPTGRRVYDNRDTRLTKWLNDGIPAVQVAEWAGNSAAVLLATYPRSVDGQLPDHERRLEAVGDLPEPPGAG